MNRKVHSPFTLIVENEHINWRQKQEMTASTTHNRKVRECSGATNLTEPPLTLFLVFMAMFVRGWDCDVR